MIAKIYYDYRILVKKSSVSAALSFLEILLYTLSI